MCGIAGYAGLDRPDLLRQMCRAIVHRGPDDEGFYAAPGVGLSMRRLSIIDLAGGHQPMANEAGDVWVVFNGEIYNYDDLREQLQQRGHVLSTTSDTETIVHLYEDHGLDFVQHLRGMFAIALWDVRRRRLVLARDRIGEKPLFFSWDGSRLLFGSEIKTILQHGGARDTDPQAVCDYLAQGYVSGATTFFRGISRLEPGHLLVHERGTITIERYWRRRTVAVPQGDERATEELASRLSDVVKSCLKSDVEVGAFLSGGLDSSLLVALMRSHAAQVRTFSVGYAKGATGFNELNHAQTVARHTGSDHRELILGARSSMELLPRILWHYDEPHGEPTSVLVYHLCEFTRGHVKVAVGGTGGDELFFGYPRHRGIRMLDYYRRLPRLLRRHVIERVAARWPESTTGSRFAKRAKRLIAAANEAPADAYLSWVSLLQPHVREELLSAFVRNHAEHPLGDRALRDYLSGPGTLLERAAALDVGGYLPEYQLAYMDRMSMAHGLEVRSPFCDYELAEFVLSLPVQYRLRGLTSKYLLKKVAERWLPRHIVNRPKVGFDSPIGQWFKTELRRFVDDFLAPDLVAQTGLLDPQAVRRLIEDHQTNRRDYSLQLWSLIALEGWHRMYIRDRAESPTYTFPSTDAIPAIAATA